MNIPSKYQARSLKASYRAGYKAGFNNSPNLIALRGPDNKEAYQHGYSDGQARAEKAKAKIAA